MVFFLKLRKGD